MKRRSVSRDVEHSKRRRRAAPGSYPIWNLERRKPVKLADRADPEWIRTISKWAGKCTEIRENRY